MTTATDLEFRPEESRQLPALLSLTRADLELSLSERVNEVLRCGDAMAVLGIKVPETPDDGARHGVSDDIDSSEIQMLEERQEVGGVRGDAVSIARLGRLAVTAVVVRCHTVRLAEV